MTHPPTRRAFLATGSAALTAAALAACSGSSAKTDPGTPGATGSTGSTGSGGGSGKPLVFYGGGTGSFTSNFNPFSATFVIGARGMIYEPLMFFNQLKADDIKPWLAKGYKLSADGKTVTFDLQTGQTWSDGQPLTAADVVFSFQLLKKTPALNGNGLKIVSVTAPNPNTVVLVMGQAAYTDIWYIAGGTYIVPEHIWSKKADPATDQDSKPVGSGAFVLTSFTPQSYLLSPNPKYAPGVPAIAGVRFVNYSGNTAGLQALQSGTLDWASVFVPQVDKQFVSRSKDFHANLFPATGTTYLLPNLKKFPTSELPVRQAMQYALDLATIKTQAFSDVALPPAKAYVVTPRDDAYVAAGFTGAPEFSTGKATAALDGAGYKKGSDGVYADPQGRRVSMTCQVITGYADYISCLQLVQEQLKAVGIELKVSQVALAAFGTARAQGNFDILIDAVYGGPGPFYLYNTMFNSALSADIGKTATADFARYSNPAVDKLLTTLGTTNQTDQATVKKLCGQIQAIVTPDIPYVAVAQRVDISEYSTRNATGFPTRDDQYAFSNVWANPDIGIVARRLKNA